LEAIEPLSKTDNELENPEIELQKENVLGDSNDPNSSPKEIKENFDLIHIIEPTARNTVFHENVNISKQMKNKISNNLLIPLKRSKSLEFFKVNSSIEPSENTFIDK
jgi:hypothetical protein